MNIDDKILLKGRIMRAILEIYSEGLVYLAYNVESNGLLLDAAFIYDLSVNLDIIRTVCDAFEIIDNIVTTYLHLSHDEKTLRQYGELYYESNLVDLINEYITDDSDEGNILYYIDYMFLNKFTLWVGERDEAVVDQIFASSAYKVNRDLEYEAFTSWSSFIKYIESRELNEIDFLISLMSNFLDGEFLDDLLFKVKIVKDCNLTGYYINDIIEIIYSAMYMADKVNKKLVERNHAILGFGNIEGDIKEIRNHEISLVNKILKDSTLFALLVRLHKLIPRCEVVNKINDIEEDLTVVEEYNGVVYRYKPEQEDEINIFPAKNYNALYLLYLRDTSFNRDVNNIEIIENDVKKEDILDIILSYDKLIS